MSDTFVGHNKEGKASFDHIYNLEDPREYFEILGRLDYTAPQNGQLLFSALIDARKRISGDMSEEIKIVDLCCSYGINGALLKYDLTLDDLYERYSSKELAGLSSEELTAADAEFFESRKKEGAPEVVGVDVAENAVLYALRAGILDAGAAENLEEYEPTDALKAAVSGTDLLTVTGGIGYVWERTFDRMLSSMTEEGSVPWVATLPLRIVDYTPIAEVLSRYGLTTEKLSNFTLTQRRFANADEQEYVLQELAEMGVDSEGKEATGYYHNDLYLSRPIDEALEMPIDELLKDLIS